MMEQKEYTMNTQTTMSVNTIRDILDSYNVPNVSVSRVVELFVEGTTDVPTGYSAVTPEGVRFAFDEEFVTINANMSGRELAIAAQFVDDSITVWTHVDGDCLLTNTASGDASALKLLAESLAGIMNLVMEYSDEYASHEELIADFVQGWMNELQ